MRPVLVSLALASAVGIFACGIADVSQGGTGTSSSGGDGGTGGDAGPPVEGSGCGIDRESGLTLCRATSMCPNVVVDAQQFPSCGFRIRGSTVDLVCGCNDQVCPMGVFTTCAQATQLLQNQTEGTVCAQVGENRCTAGTTSTTSSSTSSTSSSGGSNGCDKGCLSECGGGAGCASVCNCQ